MTFGELLKRFREERRFTTRDLGKLSKIDHAYIHRLETGAKDNPSNETVNALIKSLRLNRRASHILSAILDAPAPTALVDLFLDDPSQPLVDFKIVAQFESCRTRNPMSRSEWGKFLLAVRSLRDRHDEMRPHNGQAPTNKQGN